MNRRGFLRILGAGVAGVALEQAIPLGRVWSFPKEIIIPPSFATFPTAWYTREDLLRIGDVISIENILQYSGRRFAVREIIGKDALVIKLDPLP